MAKARFDPRAISDPKLIEILASPVRQELIDTLYALGGKATVAELAEHLGRHADGLYYHLRVLCRSELLDEIEGAEKTQRVYRLAGSGRAPMRLDYRTEHDENVRALSRYISGLVGAAERDFQQALETRSVTVRGKRRQLWAARNKGWAGPAELEEINSLLERLCTLTSMPRTPGRDQLLSLAFVLSPSVKRTKRRGSN